MEPIGTPGSHRSKAQFDLDEDKREQMEDEEEEAERSRSTIVKEPIEQIRRPSRPVSQLITTVGQPGSDVLRQPKDSGENSP